MATGKIFFLLLFSICSGIFAQDRSDIPLWRQGLGGATIGRPVAQVESVVAITDGGNIRSYTSEGFFLWDYYARGRLTPHITRSREGTTYICRTNGTLIAVNRSGRELWQINLRTPIVYPVLIGWDGRLFVFTDRRVICMTAAGYILWSRVFDHRTVLNPVRDSAGGVILVKENGELFRIDPFGNVFSYAGSPGLPTALASLDDSLDDSLSGASPDALLNDPSDMSENGMPILLLYEDRGIELFHVYQGIIEYSGRRFTLPSAPLAAYGKLDEAAILLGDGRIALFSLSEWRILWAEASHIRPGELPARPGPGDLHLFYDERGIYILTKAGASGFTSDGRRLWTLNLTGAASVPSFGDDGILYSGGSDWILYAYRLEARVRARQRLIYGEMPEGDYGTGNPGPSSWANFQIRFSERAIEERFAEIRSAIRTGTVGASEKEYAAWLMEIAGSLIAANPGPRHMTHPPVHAHQRIEAARLLAYIGSRETIPYLANLFSQDPEPTVKSAAAEAIGRIGVDPSGISLRAFENALLPPFRVMDDGVLTAVAAATGALCRFSGPPLSSAGIRLLTILAGYDRFPVVRNQAQRELNSLR